VDLRPETQQCRKVRSRYFDISIGYIPPFIVNFDLFLQISRHRQMLFMPLSHHPASKALIPEDIIRLRTFQLTCLLGTFPLPATLLACNKEKAADVSEASKEVGLEVRAENIAFISRQQNEGGNWNSS
jgi:hypothetical protein